MVYIELAGVATVNREDLSCLVVGEEGQPYH